MASKKFTLLVSLVMLGTTVGFSQLGGVLNYQDSTKLNKRKLPQYNEWKNNKEAFPPVPRAMGQLSITGGTNFINGDAPSLVGWQIGASYRKALGYAVSIRAGITYGKVRGLDYRPSQYLYNHPALAAYSKENGGPGYYVHNFKADMINGHLDLVFSLNNIMFHRKESKFNVNLFLGYSPFIYRTKMDMFEGTSGKYDWTGGQDKNVFFGRSRREIRRDLKSMLDGEFETYARVNDRSPNFDDASPTKRQWRHGFSGGGGIEYRIAPRVSLGADLRWLMTRDDYIDGWFLQNAATLTPDKDNILFTNLSINFNL